MNRFALNRALRGPLGASSLLCVLLTGACGFADYTNVATPHGGVDVYRQDLDLCIYGSYQGISNERTTAEGFLRGARCRNVAATVAPTDPDSAVAYATKGCADFGSYQSCRYLADLLTGVKTSGTMRPGIPATLRDACRRETVYDMAGDRTALVCASAAELTQTLDPAAIGELRFLYEAGCDHGSLTQCRQWQQLASGVTDVEISERLARARKRSWGAR